MWARWAGIVSAALLLVLALSPARAEPGPNVVGGIGSDITTVPWQVALIDSWADDDLAGQFCGGSILAPMWIVTTAHCVENSFMQTMNPSEVEVLAGKSVLGDTPETSGPHLAVAQILVHPERDAGTAANDVALLLLKRPLPLNGITVASVGLPRDENPKTWPAKGTPATISGWGYTAENGTANQPLQLQTASVPVLTDPLDEICGLYGADYDNQTLLCAGVLAGGIDTCQGDSGGPLTVLSDGTPTLAGITSRGVGCARADLPGMYTRITTYTPWLLSHVDQPSGLVADTSQLTFPAQTLGSAWATQTVTAVNSGPVPLTGVSAALTGADASDFVITGASCPTTLPSGGLCQVTVGFSPAVAGAKSAVLQFFPEGLQVGLLGTANAPVVEEPLVAPDAPTGLHAKASSRGVKVTWHAAPRAERYTVKLTGKSPKHRKVVGTAITRATSAMVKRIVHKRLTFTVCVSATNAAGTSPATCLKAKRKP